MSDAVCFALSFGTTAFGVVALYIGVRTDNMAARFGGSVIAVIGVLGAIACLLTD